MKEQAVTVLDKIVELQGDCLKVHLCTSCPFKTGCLLEFLNGAEKRPSKRKRLNLALDAIASSVLLEDCEPEYPSE